MPDICPEGILYPGVGQALKVCGAAALDDLRCDAQGCSGSLSGMGVTPESGPGWRLRGHLRQVRRGPGGTTGAAGPGCHPTLAHS